MSIKKKTDLKIPNEQSVQIEEGRTTQRSTNEKDTQSQAKHIVGHGGDHKSCEVMTSN